MQFALTVILCCLSSLGQAQQVDSVQGENIRGNLRLVDLPPLATPVTALTVSLYSPEPLRKIDAHPDSDGDFVLKNVPPGHYSLDLPVPARIRTFTIGSTPVNPQGFDLVPGEVGPLRIVLSYKTTTLVVDVTGMPMNGAQVVALLFPDDSYLTRPHSGTSNVVHISQTTFHYVPPGQYRLFVLDSECQDDIAFHPPLRKAIGDKATRIQVAEDGTTRATARYIDRSSLREAAREIRLDPASIEGRQFYSVPLRCQ